MRARKARGVLGHEIDYRGLLAAGTLFRLGAGKYERAYALKVVLNDLLASLI